MNWTEDWQARRCEALIRSLRAGAPEGDEADPSQRDSLLLELCALNGCHLLEAWQAAERQRAREGTAPPRDSRGVWGLALVARRLWAAGARETGSALATRLVVEAPDHPSTQLLLEQFAAGIPRGDDPEAWERERSLAAGSWEQVRDQLDEASLAGARLEPPLHVLRARLHLLGGDFEAARSACSSALDAWPEADGSDALRVERALCAFASGRADEAAAGLRAVRDRDEGERVMRDLAGDLLTRLAEEGQAPEEARWVWGPPPSRSDRGLAASGATPTHSAWLEALRFSGAEESTPLSPPGTLAALRHELLQVEVASVWYPASGETLALLLSTGALVLCVEPGAGQPSFAVVRGFESSWSLLWLTEPGAAIARLRSPPPTAPQ